MSRPFLAHFEVSKQVLAALAAADEWGLSACATFHADPTEQAFEVSLYNDEGGVIHQGKYKVVPA